MSISRLPVDTLALIAAFLGNKSAQSFSYVSHEFRKTITIVTMHDAFSNLNKIVSQISPLVSAQEDKIEDTLESLRNKFSVVWETKLPIGISVRNLITCYILDAHPAKIEIIPEAERKNFLSTCIQILCLHDRKFAGQLLSCSLSKNKIELAIELILQGADVNFKGEASEYLTLPFRCFKNDIPTLPPSFMTENLNFYLSNLTPIAPDVGSHDIVTHKAFRLSSPLFYIANNIKMLRMLFQAGVHPKHLTKVLDYGDSLGTSTYENGFHPLYFTIQKISYNCTRFLLKEIKADPNALNENYGNALDWALEHLYWNTKSHSIDIKTSIKIIKLLLKCQAQPSKNYQDCFDAFLLLHTPKEFDRLYAQRNLDAMLQTTIDWITSPHGWDRTLLIQPLISRGANPNLIFDTDTNQTILMKLLNSKRSWHLEAVDIMLEQKEINPNLQDKKGKTALMHLHKYHTFTTNFVTKLINMTDLTLRDKDGKTKLISAIETDDYRCFDLLLQVSKDIGINIQDNNGKTALMYAANFKDDYYIKHLLEKDLNIDLNIQDHEGRTALSHIVTTHIFFNDRVKNIIAKGALIDIPDINGMTPLAHAATLHSNFNLFTLLESKSNPNFPDKKSVTPLMKAAAYNYWRDLHPLKEISLLAYGADPNACDLSGKKASAYAREFKNHDIALMLHFLELKPYQFNKLLKLNLDSDAAWKCCEQYFNAIIAEARDGLTEKFDCPPVQHIIQETKQADLEQKTAETKITLEINQKTIQDRLLRLQNIFEQQIQHCHSKNPIKLNSIETIRTFLKTLLSKLKNEAIPNCIEIALAAMHCENDKIVAQHQNKLFKWRKYSGLSTIINQVIVTFMTTLKDEKLNLDAFSRESLLKHYHESIANSSNGNKKTCSVL